MLAVLWLTTSDFRILFIFRLQHIVRAGTLDQFAIPGGYSAEDIQRYGEPMVMENDLHDSNCELDEAGRFETALCEKFSLRIFILLTLSTL